MQSRIFHLTLWLMPLESFAALLRIITEKLRKIFPSAFEKANLLVDLVKLLRSQHQAGRQAHSM